MTPALRVAESVDLPGILPPRSAWLMCTHTTRRLDGQVEVYETTYYAVTAHPFMPANIEIRMTVDEAHFGLPDDLEPYRPRMRIKPLYTTE